MLIGGLFLTSGYGDDNVDSCNVYWKIAKGGFIAGKTQSSICSGKNINMFVGGGYAIN